MALMTTADLPATLRPGAAHECGLPDCTFGTEAPVAEPAAGVASLA